MNDLHLSCEVFRFSLLQMLACLFATVQLYSRSRHRVHVLIATRVTKDKIICVSNYFGVNSGIKCCMSIIHRTIMFVFHISKSVQANSKYVYSVNTNQGMLIELQLCAQYVI